MDNSQLGALELLNHIEKTYGAQLRVDEQGKIRGVPKDRTTEELNALVKSRRGDLIYAIQFRANEAAEAEKNKPESQLFPAGSSENSETQPGSPTAEPSLASASIVDLLMLVRERLSADTEWKNLIDTACARLAEKPDEPHVSLPEEALLEIIEKLYDCMSDVFRLSRDTDQLVGVFFKIERARKRLAELAGFLEDEEEETGDEYFSN